MASETVQVGCRPCMLRMVPIISFAIHGCIWISITFFSVFLYVDLLKRLGVVSGFESNYLCSLYHFETVLSIYLVKNIPYIDPVLLLEET
jgi:hypothetical protein